MSRTKVKQPTKSVICSVAVITLTFGALYIGWSLLPTELGSRIAERPGLGKQQSGEKIYFNTETATSEPSPAESRTATSASPLPNTSPNLTAESASNASVTRSPAITSVNEEQKQIFENEEWRDRLEDASTAALLGLSYCEGCNETSEESEIHEALVQKLSILEAGRLQCLRDIRVRMLDDYRPIFKDVNRIVLMDVALHTNMGDSVLWRAAIHLASLFGHSIDHVCFGSQGCKYIYKSINMFPHCNLDNIVHRVKDNGLIMMHAGGNWGDLYRFVQNYRLQRLQSLATHFEKDEYNFKVLQLPQSIEYTNRTKKLEEADGRVINALPPGMFTLFTRQQGSLDIASRYYADNIEKKLSPDIAFVLGDLLPIGDPIVDVLVLCRSDKEVRKADWAERDAIKKVLTKNNVTFVLQDWWYRPNATEFSKDNPTVLAEVRLNEAIKILSKGKVVITNRMHGSVLATMMGRTLLWVDTRQKKLAGVRDVAFSTSTECTDENLRSYEFPTMLSAAKASIQFLQDKPSLDSVMFA